jgi:hypothetical protein
MPDTPAAPAPTNILTSLLPSVPAIHGPYEDLFLEGLKVLAIVIQDAPAPVKQQFWSQWLQFHTGLQTFAEKVDVLHLFHAKE